MKLKKLEILGFKSFKDKTLLDFSNGISAVVGPNGCGKSNIVDAIRWVMGEQRVTTLRGKKMEDVIFNGSDDSLPVGMAEVSLTLENGGHQFTGKYSGLKEVTVSRRIFREGETEYYINKAPCRLLDIRELFMDAGIGVRTYSIVEQEKVARLIEAKPEERRQFIEEAAGIMKYKSRKESAVRKMESTRRNITRLNDIISEVKTQLNSTRRQAKKAEKFKALKKNIKESRLALSLQIYSQFASEEAALKGKYELLEVRCIEAETNLKSREAAMEDTRAEIAETESAIARLQERFYRIKNDIGIKEQGITFAKETISDLVAKKENSRSEIVSLRNRRESITEEIEELKLELTEAEGRISHVKESILENQERVNSLKSTEETLSDELEEENSRHIDLISENARLKNLLLSIEKGLEELQERAGREKREIEEDSGRLESLKEEVVSARSVLALEAERTASMKERGKSVSEELEIAEEGLKAAEEKVEDLKEEMGRKSSRLISLKELQQSLEWCSEGTRSVMGAVKESVLPKGDVYGLVADHIEVPEGYEIAVEAVLGEKLQYVVVKSQKEGIRAIDYLKERSSGRGNFVPLEVKSQYSQEERQGQVKLIDRVRITNKDIEGVIQYLLGDVFLVMNLNEGIRLWNKNGKRDTYVTQQGDIIHPDGVLTGGSEPDGSSLLRNLREIGELKGEVNRIFLTLEDAKKERDDKSGIISGLTEELAGLRLQMHESELNIKGREKDVERLEGEIRWIEKRINVLTCNREMMEQEKADADEKMRRIKEDLASFETKAEEVNERISHLQERWRDVRSEMEAEEEELTEQKIQMTSLEEKSNSGNSTLNRLNESISDIEGQIETAIGEADNSDIRVAEIRSNIGEEEEKLKSLYGEHEAAERDLGEKREYQSGREVIQRDTETQARKAKVAFEGLSKELNKLEMDMREAKIQSDTIKSGVYEKYQRDLDEMLSSFTPLDESEAEELRNRLEKEKKRLELFGEVNLLALSEYEQLKERHDFLSSQVEDLNASLETLQTTITKINKISRQRFKETYEGISDCFTKVFPRLFPGGTGSLSLTDESDMLETGVDIDIQIPGKKRQNLSLLSGGEKALAAVALIFAILMYRPTPFLVLDEVDAPLDDNNIALFRNLVRDMSEKSQIISITHNKKAMETADNLIGVTMAKNGISTTVSVSMN